ncbi:phospholipase [Microbacterium sp. NPDC087868]|uniref:aggregation-promoting factor C-terminal-like domain-containing protein n=1 Tax=Microbacterium sp. NPDC087868 TaxID=3364195 RepID=UPI00384FA5D7
MLHLQNTRASRRALEAATAHSAVRSRRPLLLLGTAVGAMLGITLTAGLVAGPASGATETDDASPSATTGTTTTVEASDDVAATATAATDAIDAADKLSAEIDAAGFDLSGVVPAVETAQLQSNVDTLDGRKAVPAIELTLTTVIAQQHTEKVIEQTAALQSAFTTAQEKKAADDAAAAAAAQAQAEAEAAAAALASSNTPEGAKATARVMAADQYGWGEDQFSCLSSLWQKESSWNYQAYNPSGATGIPQALPGSKMASAGSDWQTNAATQIAWGLGYISSVYGTPCSAWGHSQAMNWY